MDTLREVVNAILYVNRTGMAWEYLPHDFPPYKTVFHYYALWQADGTTEAIHDALPYPRAVIAVGAGSTASAEMTYVDRGNGGWVFSALDRVQRCADQQCADVRPAAQRLHRQSSDRVR